MKIIGHTLLKQGNSNGLTYRLHGLMTSMGIKFAALELLTQNYALNLTPLLKVLDAAQDSRVHLFLILSFSYPEPTLFP